MKKNKETLGEAIERMGNKVAAKGRRTSLDPKKQPRWSASLKEAMGIVTQRLADIEKRLLDNQAAALDAEDLQKQIERYEANTRKVLVNMQQQIEKSEMAQKQAVLDSIPQYNDSVDAPAPASNQRRIDTAITRLIGVSELINELVENRITIVPKNSIHAEFKKAIDAAKVIWLTEEDRG
jgi:hypothetical protein